MLPRRVLIEALGLGPRWVLRRDDSVPAQPVAADRAAMIARLDWAALEESVASCVACRLCESRTRTVFGVGGERADWLVIGEAPGAEEDLAGEPFVGQAGRLLDAMLASIGFSRARDVFITNVLKCRPPGNRDPLPEEVAQCRPYLERQVELLAPKLILVVGRIASHALLGTEASMASLRGKAHRFESAGREIPVVATYHPAYLLRSPEDKAKAWADLCFARELHARLGVR